MIEQRTCERHVEWPVDLYAEVKRRANGKVSKYIREAVQKAMHEEDVDWMYPNSPLRGLRAIHPVLDFSYASGESKGGKIFLGLRTKEGPLWFVLGAGRARSIARALLTAIDEKPETSDELLARFRAARKDCNAGDFTPEDAALRHGIDSGLFVAWLAKL